MAWSLKVLEKNILIGSTLVEGSTLTENEAKKGLTGKTVLGHPISEIRELLNYRSSIEWLIDQLEKSPYLSMDLILDFHQRLFVGFSGEFGKLKHAQNYTYLSNGLRYNFLHPAKTKEALLDWVLHFNATNKDKNIAKFAAQFYYEFENIHPFDDGNGRIGRILIAYWIHRNAGKTFKFKLKDKLEHLKALESANSGDINPLVDFFRKRIFK